jgi:hypothetical protein
MLLQYLDKNNLHHAYLIEGGVDVVPQILEFVKGMEIAEIKLDSFKIEDARNLKSYEAFKALDNKKAFVIYANSFLLEAQNSLLKMFEEPIENTHFFLIVPDASALLKTFVSRFYFMKASTSVGSSLEVSEAEKFLVMPLRNRLEFIKELVAKPEDLPAQPGEDDEVVDLNSTRAKALKFLNALESVLHKQVSGVPSGIFHQIFKVREFLRMPGSSPKTLMESVALIVPGF